jgi:hypothetical protein
MPRQELALNISSPLGPRRVVLQLDPSLMSQKIMLDEFTGGRLYEGETSNFVGSILQPGDTFIDIGAHVGYFSMLAAQLRPAPRPHRRQQRDERAADAHGSRCEAVDRRVLRERR